MKATYLKTLEKLGELTWLKMADRERGQLDHYTDRPAVAFPFASVKINIPKRANMSKLTQMRNVTITIRVAFERLYDSSSLNNSASQLKALEYYDKVEEVDNLFQGFSDPLFNKPWECVATLDEERPDFDIVRFTFNTTIIK